MLYPQDATDEYSSSVRDPILLYSMRFQMSPNLCFKLMKLGHSWCVSTSYETGPQLVFQYFLWNLGTVGVPVLPVKLDTFGVPIFPVKLGHSWRASVSYETGPHSVCQYFLWNWATVGVLVFPMELSHSLCANISHETGPQSNVPVFFQASLQLFLPYDLVAKGSCVTALCECHETIVGIF